MCVNNLSKVALDSAVAGIWTRDLQSQVQRPYHYDAEPYMQLSEGELWKGLTLFTDLLRPFWSGARERLLYW